MSVKVSFRSSNFFISLRMQPPFEVLTQLNPTYKVSLVWAQIKSSGWLCITTGYSLPAAFVIGFSDCFPGHSFVTVASAGIFRLTEEGSVKYSLIKDFIQKVKT